MKTIIAEEAANEYAKITVNDEEVSINPWTKNAFLAGWKAAQDNQSIQIDWTEVTQEEVSQVIADLTLQIHKLKRLVQDQSDTIHRHTEATQQRKREAGYELSTSFDLVWSEILAKANSV